MSYYQFRKCRNCEFYSKRTTGDGECRAKAPSAIPVEAGQSPALLFKPSHPVVEEDHWCGEFKLNEDLRASVNSWMVRAQDGL